MLKRVLLVLVAVLVLLLLAFPALSAEQAKTASAPAKAPPPALTAGETAKLAKLRALPPPDPNLTLVATAVRERPPAGRREIFCGVWVSSISNPFGTVNSQRLYFVNNTAAGIPPGATIEWEVDAGSCCRGWARNDAFWPPNPPSAAYFMSGTVLNPAQPWTRACRAWVWPR